MLNYWENYHSDILKAFWQHTYLVISSLFLALILAAVLIILFLQKLKGLASLNYFFSTLYSVPSYAFFALLIPISGLGETTAIFVLTLYSEYILLRTFTTGLKEIDPLTIESAFAMGMTSHQVFFKIQLPLAAPSIFSGIRLAMTSMIGIATIAATINAGGLGTILFDGLRTQSLVKMIWGSLATILLCIIVTIILNLIEKKFVAEGYR